MTKKTPKIRFQNHSEGWEMSKLNELVERVTRRNTNLESKLPLTISALDGLVDQETYFKKKVASRDVSNYYLLNKGEFAYNKSYSNGYPLGAVKRLDLHDQGVLSTLYIAFRPTNIHSDFLVSYYDTNKWHKEVSKRASEGARNHGLLNISPTDFFDTELAIPINTYEQEKIGNFFKELDKSIKLNQHALHLLKQRKQAFLQKMFPKKGESLPEIRFDGFNKKWKQKPLSEVVNTIGTGKSSPKYNYYSLDTPFGILGSTSVIGYDDDYDYDGDFILTARVGANAGNLYKYSGKVKITDNTVYIEYLNLNFLYALLNNFNLKRLSFGTGQPLIKTSELKKLKLFFPTVEEQQKIGNFFKELNNSITLQEEKLESLKQMKKAFLQKMFV